MFNNISGFGTLATIQAVSQSGTGGTYPAPVPLSDWAQDVDALDFGETRIGDAKNGPNGNTAFWSISETIELTIAPIVGSNTDQILQILYQANRPQYNKTSAFDNISLTIIYPDLVTSLQLYNGVIVSGFAGKGLNVDGLLKTRTYKFKFNSYSGGL